MFDWVISDTHFDHGKIIELCDRPFNTVDEMDLYLLTAWNKHISEDDSVLFLGDLAMARPEVANEYFTQLNGNITFLEGNHDDSDLHESLEIPVLSSITFEHKGLTFYCSHYPPEDDYTPPVHTQYWLCGHTHNDNPFFDPHKKAFNFSVDVTGFEPVPFENVLDFLLTQKSRKIKQYTEHTVFDPQSFTTE